MKRYNVAKGIIYPPLGGAINKSKTTLNINYEFDRYVGVFINNEFKDFGSYVSQSGASFESRALPEYFKDWNTGNILTTKYRKYKVLQPIEVEAGDIIPWFGQIGLGKQYLLPLNIEKLKQQNKIIEIVTL